MLDIVKGNILKCDAEALVNTVNTRGHMGKGIALQFKKAYQNMFNEYQKAVKKGLVSIGCMHVYETGLLHNPKYIINFPTKGDWRKPSKIEYIEEGLRDLVRVVGEKNIKSIAIPPLGCGLGGLDWEIVKERIEMAFLGFPSVQVWLFEPGHTPAPKDMQSNTQKPNMTKNNALILLALHNYLAIGYESTWVELQKIAYFLQEAGQDMDLHYEKGLYGPYSDKLRHIINRFEGHYTSGYGDGTSMKPQSVITLLPNIVEEARQCLTDSPDSTAAILQRLAQLITGFETPYGLELLGTVHWVVKKDGINPNKEQDVVTAVHGWTKRKAKLMRVEHIISALHRLTEEKWF